MKLLFRGFFFTMAGLAFTGCLHDKTTGPRVTGQVGVRVQSKDTSRIAPGPPR